MEKLGVEVEKQQDTNTEKQASDNTTEHHYKCRHPEEELLKPDDVTVFCKKCGKYLKW